MRQGFIFNSEGQMLAFEVRCNDVVKHTHKGVTNLYSKGFKHPTQSKWAVEVEVNGSEYWTLLEADLNPNDINNLVILTSDWFPNVEL